MSRIVCDTNIIVSAFLWNGLPRKIIGRVGEGKDALFSSRELLIEFEKTLKYKRLEKVLAESGLQARSLVMWLAGNASIVMARPLPTPVVLDDPSDDAVLSCARTACCDAIVSGDKHLLRIREYNGIVIMSPRDYLVRCE